MDLDEFRKQGHRMVDWMADYLGTVETLPVRAQSAPGAVAAQLPIAPPLNGEAMDDIFADFQAIVMPGITHWQHPRFMAYFPANSSPPAVLAEMLTSTLAAQCMLWQTSPAATEMETRVLDWLRQMLGLPNGFTGVIQDSASTATLCALLVARERVSDWQVNQSGLRAAPAMAVYCSAEAHSSIEKGVRIAGFGAEFLRQIPVNENFAMRPEALAAAIEADLQQGVVPTCIVACIGTTGVGASDPLAAIAAIAEAHEIYLHVDAAWAGSALILPEQRHLIEGIEAADSFVFNPHKWLLTNFDCSAHFVKDVGALVKTFSILPAYLRGRETGEVIDYRDWGVPLGRRFRALKLWFVIRSYGLEGLQKILRRHIALASEAESWAAAAADFEILAARNLSLFNFRYHPAGLDDEGELDQLNQRLVETINDRGVTYLTQNYVAGRYAIRLNVGQSETQKEHVEQAWAEIISVARALAPTQDPPGS